MENLNEAKTLENTIVQIEKNRYSDRWFILVNFIILISHIIAAYIVAENSSSWSVIDEQMYYTDLANAMYLIPHFSIALFINLLIYSVSNYEFFSQKKSKRPWWVTIPVLIGFIVTIMVLCFPEIRFISSAIAYLTTIYILICFVGQWLMKAWAFIEFIGLFTFLLIMNMSKYYDYPWYIHLFYLIIMVIVTFFYFKITKQEDQR